MVRQQPAVKKLEIQVFERISGKKIETIKRKVWSEACGNFCPIFCIYKKERRLVHSRLGDISDPFRAGTDYLKFLYIEV